ncbi:MAG TPA: phospholipase D-like domain-containing protein [Anaerolineaceae bacterium]|nr:phospholipase D-like domain-containing protein [Anaerolineaceae bacterium]
MSSRRRSPNLISLVVLAIVIAVAGYVYRQGQEPTPAPTAPATQAAPGQPTPAESAMPAWLHVFFTNPNPPDQSGSGVDQVILPLIQSATQSIDVTSFDLNLPDLVNALADAQKRGVIVRVVYDGTNGEQKLDNAATNNKTFDAIKTLKAAGVGLVNGGRSNGLMHDKIVIIDGKTLLMGSWNLSYNDTYRNNNNLLEITAPQLIANYQAKFNELFVDKRFGAKAEIGALAPSLTLDGVRVENYFSPTDQVMAHLVQTVQGAKRSVHVMIFTFTDPGLASALIERAKAALDVQGVIEDRGASQGALPTLFCAHLPFKTDGNKYTMHHKVIVIDGQTVITGSFNFTKSADTANDDNLIILHSPAVAALYEQEYQQINAAGQLPQAAGFQCP